MAAASIGTLQDALEELESSFQELLKHELKTPTPIDRYIPNVVLETLTHEDIELLKNLTAKQKNMIDQKIFDLIKQIGFTRNDFTGQEILDLFDWDNFSKNAETVFQEFQKINPEILTLNQFVNELKKAFRAKEDFEEINATKWYLLDSILDEILFKHAVSFPREMQLLAIMYLIVANKIPKFIKSWLNGNYKNSVQNIEDISKTDIEDISSTNRKNSDLIKSLTELQIERVKRTVFDKLKHIDLKRSTFTGEEIISLFNWDYFSLLTENYGLNDRFQKKIVKKQLKQFEISITATDWNSMNSALMAYKLLSIGNTKQIMSGLQTLPRELELLGILYFINSNYGTPTFIYKYLLSTPTTPIVKPMPKNFPLGILHVKSELNPLYRHVPKFFTHG